MTDRRPQAAFYLHNRELTYRDLAHLTFFRLRDEMIDTLRQTRGPIPDEHLTVTESRDPGSSPSVWIDVRVMWAPPVNPVCIIDEEGTHDGPWDVSTKGPFGLSRMIRWALPRSTSYLYWPPDRWCDEHQAVQWVMRPSLHARGHARPYRGPLAP